jgi:hypothetical protein
MDNPPLPPGLLLTVTQDKLQHDDDLTAVQENISSSYPHFPNAGDVEQLEDPNSNPSKDAPNKDERVFKALLTHQLCFNTASILFLEEQNVSTIHHLCVLGVDETQCW